MNGSLGEVLAGPATGYAFVYYLEVFLLFTTLVVIGPLAAFAAKPDETGDSRFGLAEFPS